MKIRFSDSPVNQLGKNSIFIRRKGFCQESKKKQGTSKNYFTNLLIFFLRDWPKNELGCWLGSHFSSVFDEKSMGQGKKCHWDTFSSLLQIL